MEVLKESVEPIVRNAVLQWNLPDEYSLVNSTPNSFHNMYIGNSYTAYAFLRKTCQSLNGKSLTSSAIISGIIGKDIIQFVVKPAIHFLAVTPDLSSTHIITQTAVWSKLLDLEEEVACSRKGEPKEKTSHARNGCSSTECTQSLHKQLVEISVLSNIPTPLTYLTSESKNMCRRIIQVLPYGKGICAIQESKAVYLSYHKSSHRRRSHRHHLRRCHLVSPGHASISLTSVARQTFSNLSSRLKSMVGLFLPDQNSVSTDDVQMLEDEVEYQEKKGSRLQFDDSHNIIYPSFYYSIPVDSKMPSHGKESKEMTVLKNEMESTKQSESSNLGGRSIIAEQFSDEEGEVNISDNESDSSVDPEWDDLRPPSNLLPLIHMQLCSGGWPLVRPFSYAVGIPINEIRKLPLVNEYNGRDSTEDGANFWSTALAVTCLEEHFSHLSAEWEIIAFKGRRWLERNRHVCSLTMDEVYSTARKLVIKQT